ncbi:MAG: nucleotidyltransferase domain-containing protein [Eubacteriales bacterium]
MSRYIELTDIINKYNLYLLVTFGSYNTEKFHKESDIDVAYLAKEVLSTQQEYELLHDIVLYFKRDKIDLVNLSKAVPLLLYEIACNSQVLYEENNSYLNFKLKASARYADTKFLRDLRRDYLNDIVSS